MKKSLFIISLALAMVLSSCGEPTSEDTGSDTSSTTQESSSDSSSSTSTSTTTDTTTSSSSSSTTTTLPPGPTPVDPTQEKAAIVVGQTAYKFEAMSREASWPANLVEKYKATVGTVTADQELKLYYDGAQVTSSIGPDGDDYERRIANNVKTVNNKFYVENYATNVDVYFSKYNDGYSFWVTGGTRQVLPVTNEPGWYVFGTFTNWQTLSTHKFSNEGQLTLSLTSGEFKFKQLIQDAKPTYLGFDNINPKIEAALSRKSETDDNIVINHPGEYTFSLSGDVVTVTYPDDIVPVDVKSSWYAEGTMNGWQVNDDYNFVIDTTSTDERVEAQYRLTHSFGVDEELKFYDTDTDLWIGFDNIENPTEAITRNPSDGDSNNNMIIKAAGEYTFYLKKLKAPIDGKLYLFYVSYPDSYSFAHTDYVRRYTPSGYSFTELCTNSGNPSEVYTESPIELESGDIVDIVLDGDEYRYSSVKPVSVNYGDDFDGNEYGLIRILVSGAYNFYTDVNDDNRGSTYIARVLPNKRLEAYYDTDHFIGTAFDSGHMSATYINGEEVTHLTFDQVVVKDENGRDVNNEYIFDEAKTYVLTVTYTISKDESYEAEIQITVYNYPYALYFGSEKSIALKPDGEVGGREQFTALQVEFKNGETFDIQNVNAEEDTHFVAPIENESFDSYVTKNETTYTVNSDFAANVYVKLAPGDDLIYFEVIHDVAAAQIKIGKGEKVAMGAIDPDPNDPSMIGQFEYVAKLSKGEAIEFYVNGEKLSITTSGNAIVKDDVITIRKSGDNLHIYLKVYASRYDSYVTGFEDIDVESWYLMGTPNSWEFDNNYKFVESDRAEVPEDCFAQLEFTTRLSAGDEFKIHKDTDDQWIGWTNNEVEPSAPYIEEGCRDNFEQSASDDNIKCKNEGAYTIYLKVLDNLRGYSLWIHKLATNVLNATYTGGNIEKGSTIAADSFAVLYTDDNAVTSDVTTSATYFIGSDPIGDLNNYEFETAGNIEITAKYTPEGKSELTATFTVHVADPSSLKEVNIYINGSGIDTWYKNNDAKFYVWAWDGTNSQLFEGEASVAEPGKICITIECEFVPTGVKLFRCSPDFVPGSGCPGDGDAWNHTGDLSVDQEKLSAEGTFQ